MKNAIWLSTAIICMLFTSNSFAQSIVNDVDISANEANIEMTNQTPQNYLVEIGGPDDYYWKQRVEHTNEISLSNQQVNGESFPDGQYTLQVTPVYTLTDAQRADLIKLRQANDRTGIKAYRDANNLPSDVDQFVVYFSIRNGKFITPDNQEAQMQVPTLSSQWNEDHPSLYASLHPVETLLPSRLIEDKTTLSEDAQVFADDVVAQGSLCVGIDCTTSESFGFDTQRFKENNLRINFDDTSASASFPSNDWRITINDSNNGGASYFAVQDATANTTPFQISAGAGNNAIYVKDDGQVGLGNANPILELHITDGDSPSIRLEQDGSNGWASRIWDLAGNETNFFIRDVVNSSALPFRILAGAPNDALVLRGNGNVGIGTDGPSQSLHVKSGNVYVENGSLGVNKVPTQTLDVDGTFQVSQNSILGSDATSIHTFFGSLNGILSGQSTFYGEATAGFQALLHFDASNNYVGIGTTTPSHAFQVNSDDVVKTTAGPWSGASDRRLKTDIKDYTDGLDQLMRIRPVTYRFNGKLGLSTEDEHVGVIAQEMQDIAPYMIKSLNDNSEEGQAEDYLAYDPTALTYMLVNAVQEQQAIIDAQKEEIDGLQAELAQLQTLKAEVAALAELVKAQQSGADANEAVGEE
ncbi:MAG: tail fiber domain-containing protein [Bacteroidota bacterium]